MAEPKTAEQTIDKPEFWQPGFGNDWLEHFYELADPELPGALALYLPSGWGVLGLGSLLGLWLFSRWHIRWRERQLQCYRSQALAELAAIRAGLEHGQHQLLAQVPALLRRCALSIDERGRVASLSGRPWCDYLCAMLPPGAGRAFEYQQLQTIQSWAYAASAELPGGDSAELDGGESVALLLDKTEYWLHHHRLELKPDQRENPIAEQGAADAGV